MKVKEDEKQKKEQLAVDGLVVEQKQQKFTALTVVQAVPTRWNSEFLMAQRLLLLREHIDAYLSTHKDLKAGESALP